MLTVNWHSCKQLLLHTHLIEHQTIIVKKKVKMSLMSTFLQNIAKPNTLIKVYQQFWLEKERK